MGWLERWDERNQRTVEYQNETYRRDENHSRWLAVVVGIEVVALILRRVIGEGWIAGVLAVLAFVAFVVLVVTERRRRRAWEAARAASERTVAADAAVVGRDA